MARLGSTLLWTFLGLALMAGCASQPARKAMQIELGMSAAQVKQVAGEPLDRSFKGSQEKWIYGNEEPGAPKKAIVFRSGKVVSLENVEEGPSAQNTSAQGPKANAGPVADLPCSERNSFGAFAEGGGCNLYGCWPPGGYCNGFGCSAHGVCTNRGCPQKIETYRCVE